MNLNILIVEFKNKITACIGMPNFYANNVYVGTLISPGLPSLLFSDKSGFSSFGTLFKHCKKNHAPACGNYMRLGTLSEYRRQENNAVRDEEEGLFQVSLNFQNETCVSVDALSKITFGTSPVSGGNHRSNIRSNIFTGVYNQGLIYSKDNVDVSRFQDGKITLKGSIDIFLEGADAYVFCMSTSDECGSIILDSEYDSVWAVRPECVLEFTNRIIKELEPYVYSAECFKENTIGIFKSPAFVPPKLGEYGIGNVIAEIWAIDYREKTIEITSDITEGNIIEVHRCLDRAASIKPTKYSNEKEVRIVFRPVLFDKRNGQRYLNPRYLKPTTIPFDGLLDLIDIVS